MTRPRLKAVDFPAEVLTLFDQYAWAAQVPDDDERVRLEYVEYPSPQGSGTMRGYLALGPDALTPLGGYPGTDDEGRTMQRQLDRETMTADFVAGARYLMGHSESTGRVGAVDFCFGGGMVGTLAVRMPDLAAGVVFYGSQPASDDVPRIQTPLRINYAGLDERVNAGDTTPRYDQEAAQLAQERTIAFFREHLR